MHSKVYRAIFFALSLTLAFCVTVIASNAATEYCYGMYWRFPNVGNLQIGAVSNNYDVASFRIRAQHSGQVDSLRSYLMPACGSTYSVGDGGIFRVEIQTDDGTSNHLPSGQVLTSLQIDVNANQSTKTANPAFGPLESGGGCFNRLYFNAPATLEAGQLYHIVFTNPSPQADSNWYSVDCIFNYVTVSPVQPAYSDTDLAVVTHGGQIGGWSNPNAHYTPIYSLYFTDGYVQGQPYLQMGYVLGDGGFPIYGSTHKIRQPFIPSDADKIATAVSTCAYRVGSPGDLRITLQDRNLNTIATGTVPASNFPTTGTKNIRWGKVTFGSPVTLVKGTTYYVEVTAPGDSSNGYRAYSGENGKPYGFESNAADGFKDGAYSKHFGQYMNGGSWQTDYYDMPIYFDCVTETPVTVTRNSIYPILRLLLMSE